MSAETFLCDLAIQIWCLIVVISVLSMYNYILYSFSYEDTHNIEYTIVCLLHRSIVAEMLKCKIDSDYL